MNTELKITLYKAEHLLALSLQEAQASAKKNITPENAKALEETTAFTAMADGKPLACAGIVQHWGGRYEVWSYLSLGVNPALFRKLHLAAKQVLSVHKGRRLEMYVDPNFMNAHRWAKALGFKLETPRLEKYWPDGRDAALYVRIQ